MSLVPQQAMTFQLSGLGLEIAVSFSPVPDLVQPTPPSLPHWARTVNQSPWLRPLTFPSPTFFQVQRPWPALPDSVGYFRDTLLTTGP